MHDPVIRSYAPTESPQLSCGIETPHMPKAGVGAMRDPGFRAECIIACRNQFPVVFTGAMSCDTLRDSKNDQSFTEIELQLESLYH